MDGIRKHNKTGRKGIFRKLKAYLERNRLGELLVLSGIISPQQLHHAIALQRQTHQPLGEIFVRSSAISRHQLALLLARQNMTRFLAAFVFFAFSFMPFAVKQARADILHDIPSQITLVNAQAGKGFSPDISYPALFGTDEKRSHNLEPFTKWSGMFERFERSITNPGSNKMIRRWHKDLEALKNKDLEDMAREVNHLVNKEKYIIDSKNWGKSDYWATPIEFFRRGGDCEDFAIAKYAALRALGVPEERLRVAIVHDKIKNIPHAVLIVYTDQGGFILDNQVKTMKSERRVTRYRPIFSINRQAWWLHTAPSATILASAD